MSDLALGYVIIAALAAGLFLLTFTASRRLSPAAGSLATAIVVALLFVYIRTLWSDVRLVRWLPVTNLIVVGNWLPLFAAALAGLVWQSTSLSRLRRSLATVGLVGAGAIAACYPLAGSTPTCGDRWDRLGMCVQTTRVTCSPAAAATLLRHYGIATSEQEMARLCLTRHGTSWQGLYRGLKLKTAGTRWEVRLVAMTADELLQPRTTPLLLSVGIGRGADVDREFTREFGWLPGVNHSVVLLGVNGHRSATIADPAFEMCREQWDAGTLRTLWQGYAFELVPRE